MDIQEACNKYPWLGSIKLSFILATCSIAIATLVYIDGEKYAAYSMRIQSLEATVEKNTAQLQKLEKLDLLTQKGLEKQIRSASSGDALKYSKNLDLLKIKQEGIEARINNLTAGLKKIAKSIPSTP